MKSLSFASIEADFFTGRNPLKKMLSISLDLMGARHSGLLYGTDETHNRFLPSSRWDRGVMDRFEGRGPAGIFLKLFGTRIISIKGLSPVFFYTRDADGNRHDTHGIIAYVLRNCADYYRKGINVIICPDTDRFIRAPEESDGYHYIPFYVYDGQKISKPKNHIKVDTRIVRHFQSSNSVYVILPDYGILVINTADPELMAIEGDAFVRESELRQRLDMLIHLVERSSLASLGRLKGKKGAELLWRKEAHLRKAYTHLSESEKKYRDLYENAPIAYLSLTPESIIFQCNRKAVTLSGIQKDDLIGTSAYSLFLDREEAKQNFRMIWETLRKGQSVRDLEVQMMQPSGALTWVSLSIDAILGKDGRIIEMRAMVLDISRRKTLERQLVQAQKMEAIGTLARGIAHDFNNILSPVSGYAQMLLMDRGRSDQERARLQTILDCTRHAKDLVNQILTFSRQREHRLNPVDAKDTIEESMTLVRSFLPAGVKLTTRFGEDCGMIMADPVQLHQVIMNLVSNSFQAMEAKGGSLVVSLEKARLDEMSDGIMPGSYVCLKVSDTGPGIDAALLSQIFEPYITTRAEGKGSGIGLSVVQGIISGHGGHIRVRSEPGMGTCFTIYLPVCRNRGKQPPTADPSQDTGILTGTESILLVDDNTTVAYMHTSLLESLGYRVTCFTHSLDALDMFTRSPDDFDLVISDLTMPDMNGLELAAKITDIRPSQKVLICTGLGDEPGLDREQVGCVTGFISKPVELHILSRLIRTTLDQDLYRTGT